VLVLRWVEVPAQLRGVLAPRCVHHVGALLSGIEVGLARSREGVWSAPWGGVPIRVVHCRVQPD